MLSGAFHNNEQALDKKKLIMAQRNKLKFIQQQKLMIVRLKRLTKEHD